MQTRFKLAIDVVVIHEEEKLSELSEVTADYYAAKQRSLN